MLSNLLIVFACVGAVSIAATLRKFFDIGKGAIDIVFACPRSKLAEAWSIDQQRAARRFEQLAMRGGVASAAVGFTNRAGRLPLPAQKTIDERRLPCP